MSPGEGEAAVARDPTPGEAGSLPAMPAVVSPDVPRTGLSAEGKMEATVTWGPGWRGAGAWNGPLAREAVLDPEPRAEDEAASLALVES